MIEGCDHSQRDAVVMRDGETLGTYPGAFVQGMLDPDILAVIEREYTPPYTIIEGRYTNDFLDHGE